MTTALRALLFSLLGVTVLGACAVDGSDDGEDGDEEVASEADALAAGGMRRNADIDSVVVWSQNIRMRKEDWKQIVRCMGDKACNGLGAVPDVILLEEAGCTDTEAIRLQLKKPIAEGGLGITGWKKFCVENYSNFSGHWMSNGIIYRSDRFELKDSRKVPFQTGNGTSCSFEGKELPIVKLFDRKRKEAGKLETHATFAVRHDDHFGANKDVCANKDDDTKFCSWRNSKIIDKNVREMGGGLFVEAGDWNYAAKYCKDDAGKVDRSWKYAYKCTTKGLTETCDGGKTQNLGWRDPRLEADPKVYDDAKSIDFIHAKDTHGFVLNQTAKNKEPGVIDKCFYCKPGSIADRMTDHDGRLMRIRY